MLRCNLVVQYTCLNCVQKAVNLQIELTVVFLSHDLKFRSIVYGNARRDAEIKHELFPSGSGNSFRVFFITLCALHLTA